MRIFSGNSIPSRRFFWVRHNYFVGSDRSDKLLVEIFQMEEHGYGFIEYRCNEEG